MHALKISEWLVDMKCFFFFFFKLSSQKKMMLNFFVCVYVHGGHLGHVTWTI